MERGNPVRVFFAFGCAIFLLAADTADRRPDDRLRADTAHLSSDAMQGRDTGSAGYQAAAAFVAHRFQQIGLQPGGDQGGWFQQVPLRLATHARPPRLTLRIGRRRPKTVRAADFALRPSVRDGSLNLEAELVFVGHGISDRQLGIDEYSGLDVRDKIVVALRGAPSGLPDEIAAHLEQIKEQVAASKGAAGFALLSFGGFLSYNPAANVVSQPVLDWVGAHDAGDAAKLRVSLVLSPDASRGLFEAAPRSLDSVRSGSRKPIAGFPLRARLNIDARSDIRPLPSPNVVGMLPGSDPVLRNNPVLVTAHLDHLGLDRAGRGDAIFNGAIDNAAGVAVMLEIARSLAAGPRPRRPVWFVALTGEERGMLGASYFAASLRAEPAAAINLDMPLLTYDFSDIAAFGADRSTLSRAVTAAAAETAVAVGPDPMPEQNLFVRSDHYRFILRGVPSLFVMTGYANGGREAWQNFFSHRYHRPNDEDVERLNWRAGARFAALNTRIVRRIADDPQPPFWYAGDYFGETFGAARPHVPRPTGR